MSFIALLIIFLISFIIFTIMQDKPAPPLVMKSALKLQPQQYYSVNTISHDAIVQLLVDKFIKFKHMNFNLSNLPVSSIGLKETEATVIANTIMDVFNKALEITNTRLKLSQVVPLYKMETDIEVSYSMQIEFKVYAKSEPMTVENKILRLQLNIIMRKRPNDETFFDKVLIDSTPATTKKIDKIYVTQIKKIDTLDNNYNLFQDNTSPLDMDKFNSGQLFNSGSKFNSGNIFSNPDRSSAINKEVDRINKLHSAEINNQFTSYD